MRRHERWLKWVLEASAAADLTMPWARGAGRALPNGGS